MIAGLKPRDPVERKRRAVVFLGLFLAIALDTTVQIFWKAAVPRGEDFFRTLRGTLFNWLFELSILLHIWQFFNWMMVLANADLSFAQPITALSYVSVTVLAAIFFGERITILNVIGVAFILAGVYFVSSTQVATQRESKPIQAAPAATEGIA